MGPTGSQTETNREEIKKISEDSRSTETEKGDVTCPFLKIGEGPLNKEKTEEPRQGSVRTEGSVVNDRR